MKPEPVNATDAAPPARPGVGTPPGLLLAALAFWGWQTGWPWVGLGAGVVLELPRVIGWRWEVREEDFRRLWNFSFLLGLALGIYLFSTDEAGGGAGGTAIAVARKAGLSGLNAGMGLLRVLPLVWFLFVAAQCFSTRQTVPLAVISWLVRRWQRLDDLHRATGQNRSANLTYPYFMVCVFAAGIHDNDGSRYYFIGQSVLLAWALWPLRARRAPVWVWLAALTVALTAGALGSHGLGRLEQYLNNYNAQWITRMMRARMEPERTRTSIGDIGQLKLSGEIVLRVKPLAGPVPVYLRESCFRKYNSQIWQTAGRTNDFVGVNHAVTNENDWPLLPGPERPGKVQIAAYLENWSREQQEPEGILPLPSGVVRLDNLPAFTLQKNSFGTVLAVGPGLMIYQAQFGPGPTLDCPPDPNWDLQVPPNEKPAVDQVVAELKASGLDDEHKLLAVQQFFARQFTYTLWIKPTAPGLTNVTPIGNFLLHSRAGYCEYFATATVLLLRELHLPARYCIGYVVHEMSGHQFVVRERDAHAWCLVWSARQQAWETFDTTPSTGDANAGWHLTQPLSDAWSWLKFQFAKFRWGQTEYRKYALWLMLPVLGLSLFQIFFRRGRPRRGAGKATGPVRPDWPGLDSEFYQLEAWLATRGTPRRPGETLGSWLERSLADASLAEWRTPLRELLRLHYQYRFDPAGLPPAEREKLQRAVATHLQKLRAPA